VPLINDAIHVDASEQHTCAVRRSGDVTCWGRNQLGQVNGVASDTFAQPTTVTLPASAVEVGASLTFSCARLADGTVACWGDNGKGQLGSNSAGRGPTLVPGLAGVRQIAAGLDFACALRETGEVLCWGSDEFGQHGAGVASDANLTTVKGLNDAVQISAGLLHMCALRKTAQVVCWGRGEWGNLGNGQVTAPKTGVNQPAAVLDLDDAIGLAAGGVHTCVRRSNGSISCWGLNDSGQLGDGTADSRSRPVSAAGFP
jgi:alpha-tubulin suppressor-like RCC1 family protein